MILSADLKEVKIYGRKIISGLELKVDRPGIVGLHGPSGSGKTTFLKVLSGIIPGIYSSYILRGEILINGKSPESAVKEGLVAYVPQTISSFFLGNRVGEELLYSKNKDNLLIKGLMLDPGRKVDSLSAGEKYRLLLAVSIYGVSKLLLLDEPTSFIDPWSLEDVLTCIKKASMERDALTIVVDNRREVLDKYTTMRVSFGEDTEYFDYNFWNGDQLDVFWNGKNDARIHVAGLTLKFDERQLFGDLELRLSPGEGAAIIGKNGAGKTSLLKCIAGWRKCKGKIDTDKKEIFYIPEDPIYWFSRHSVWDEAREGVGSYIREKIVLETLSFFHIKKRMYDNPYNLSVGEARRLSFTKWMLSGRKILLIDEPSLGLDEGARQVLKSLIENYRDAGGIVVMATHDMSFAKLMDEKIVLESKSNLG